MQSVRMKYPDVAAADDYIHVVWQNGLPGSANYTCSWARRENKVGGKWLPVVNIKQNRNMSRSSHTPMVSLDEKQTPISFTWTTATARAGKSCTAIGPAQYE